MALKDKLRKNLGVIAVLTTGFAYSLGTFAHDSYNSYLKRNYPEQYKLNQVEREVSKLELTNSYLKSEIRINNPQNIFDYITDAPMRMIRGVEKGMINGVMNLNPTLIPKEVVKSTLGISSSDPVMEVVLYSLEIENNNKNIKELKAKQKELEMRVSSGNQ